jgi:carnitine-CoA ligase
MRDFPLQQRTIGHVLAAKAAECGPRTGLLWEDRRYSFADLHTRTNRYANGFLRAGIRKGTHVAVMLANCPEFLFVVWGLGKIGAVAVPLNTAAKGELLSYFLDQSDTETLIAGAEFLPRLGEVLPKLPRIKTVYCLGTQDAGRDAPVPILDLKALEHASDLAPPLDAVAFSDPSYIIYTSGTTGPSKGVVSPQAQGLNVGRHLVAQYGYTRDDIIYTCLPLFHVNALWYSANAALWADAALALAPRFSVSQFWDDIGRTRATQFNALGVMASLLLKQPPSAAERTHNVRQSMVVPLSKETYRAYGERFGLKVTSLFAATETFAVTIFTPSDPETKGASAGHPHDLADIAIVDDADQPVPAGEVGEICVRPQQPWISMLGYYKMPEATLAAYRNQWFHTGDRGFLDTDSYLWFVDRKKESIRRRGENISAFEVEMLIAKHEAVHEVAAVAVASDLSEDDVMVYVVKKPGEVLTEIQLVEFCASTMSYFMVPRYVAFIDVLPKTASEKIEKYKLKQLAEATRATLWDREKAGIKIKRS